MEAPLDMTQFGNQIRVLRTMRGLSQEQLASLVGVSRQSINAIENGHWTPKEETEAAIREALNWNADTDVFFARVLELLAPLMFLRR